MPTTISQDGGSINIKLNTSNTNTIDYNQNGGAYTSISSWPLTFTNTLVSNLTLTVTIIGSLTISNSTTGTGSSGTDVYFITGSNKINIIGSSSPININNITNYLGLIKSSDGNTNINIENIGINVTSSTLPSVSPFGGWVCQLGTGQNSGSVTVKNCYSNGPINFQCGGICAPFGGAQNGSLILTNCYSTGIMTSTSCGGICGSNSGINATSGGYCEAISCYYNQNISQNNSGGIFGYRSGRNGSGLIIGTVKATNCYTTGNITSSTAGGIFASESSTGTSATNCYSLGTVVTSGTSIFGSSSAGTTLNCYGLNGAPWADATAQTILTNGPTSSDPKGTIWSGIATDTPWIPTSFSYSPYSGYPNTTYNQTIVQGQSTNTPLTQPVTTYYLISSINEGVPSTVEPTISINSSTGVISTTALTPVSTYNIQVISGTTDPITSSTLSSSSIFTLEVNLLCYLATTKILCLIDGEEKWIQIKDIQKDTLVKTYLHGYKKMLIKGKTTLINTNNKTIHKLYKLSKNKNTDLIEDLYTSGQHSILVDKLTDEQTKLSLTKWSRILEIDEKKLLMAWVNSDFEPVIDNNQYDMYQIVLESDDVKKQYGIWANGILSETMSKYTFDNKKQLTQIE